MANPTFQGSGREAVSARRDQPRTSCPLQALRRLPEGEAVGLPEVVVVAVPELPDRVVVAVARQARRGLLQVPDCRLSLRCRRGPQKNPEA